MISLVLLDRFEASLRRIASENNEHQSPVERILRQEISLTLEQLDSVRLQGKGLEKRLTDVEMDLKSQMLNLGSPRNEYSFAKWVTRERMKQGLSHTLVRLEHQSQRLELEQEKTERALQDRLVELYGRWEQVCLSRND